MDEKNVSLRQLISDFNLAKQVTGKSQKTLDFYEQNLSRSLWWLERTNPGTTLKEIDATKLRSLLAYVKNTPNRWQFGSTSSRKPASMATVDAYWRTLHAFFSWLLDEGIITAETNPMKNITRPKVPEKVVQDIPLSLIKKAVARCGKNPFLLKRNKAIILSLLDTGYRLSACHGTAIPNIETKTGMATMWEKGSVQRHIHFAATSLEALKEYLVARRQFKHPSLWLKEDGTPLSKAGIQSMVRRLKRFGGNVRWTPHTFRNTFAINLLRGGADTFSLQMLGGWKDLEMPRHYTKAGRTLFKEAIDIIKNM